LTSHRHESGHFKRGYVRRSGLGWRFEAQTSRNLVTTTNILIEHMDSQVRHQFVANACTGVDYRFANRFSGSVRGCATYPIAGFSKVLDYLGALSLTAHFYP
jgi:hypothetical protein